MITKINQSLLTDNMRSLINYTSQLGKTVAKNKKPIYPTPSGMNIKVPYNPYLDASDYAKCRYHKEATVGSSFDSIPDGYTKDMGIELAPESRNDIMLTIAKKAVKAGIGNRMLDLRVKIGELVTPSYFRTKLAQLEPHYYVDELWSGGKNTGTNAIKNVVLKSLDDPQTQGRVLLEACSIDGKTNPIGFYYKLGFRSVNPDTNADCAKWLAEGGKRKNAPRGCTKMYLPKENIQHCLNYGLNLKA